MYLSITAVLLELYIHCSGSYILIVPGYCNYNDKTVIIVVWTLISRNCFLNNLTPNGLEHDDYNQLHLLLIPMSSMITLVTMLLFFLFLKHKNYGVLAAQRVHH
jgi:hypothetical protein